MAADDPDAGGFAASQAVRAFGQVARAILDENLKLDDLLHLIAARISELSGVTRCGLYLREEGSEEVYRGRVGHDGGRDIGPAVRRLVVGTPADQFTREILETRRPVLLRDARDDPRPVRSTMREWRVHSVLGVPMVLGEEVIGLVFLDDVGRSHEFTETDQELCAAFANLAATAIVQSELTTELRGALETTARQNTALRRAASIDDRLSTLVLDGANLSQIAQQVAELTNRPCAIHDGAGVRCATGVPPGGRADLAPGVLDARHVDAPAVVDALAALNGKRVGVIGPFPSLGMQHRYLMAPIVARQEHWGYVILTEHAARFGAADMLVARRAATIVALEMSAERRAAATVWDAEESLLSELIRGNSDPTSLDWRANAVGVDLGAPHVVALMGARDGEKTPLPSARDVAAAVRAALEEEFAVLATGTADGVVMMIGLAADVPTREAIGGVQRALRCACERLAPGATLAIGVSTVCRGAADYVGAYSETLDLAAVIDGLRPAGGHEVLAVDDLGAGRMLLMGVHSRSVDRFVCDVLGPLLDAKGPRSQELLLTLQAFLDASRSIRICAARLNVHENTVRYRLARIEETLGLDITSNAEDQLNVQIALTVAALRGRLAPPRPLT